jgi:hypothetical protein
MAIVDPYLLDNFPRCRGHEILSHTVDTLEHGSLRDDEADDGNLTRVGRAKKAMPFSRINANRPTKRDR